MKDVFSIIRQLTERPSNSLFEEEQIRDLQPVDHVIDYYINPMEVFLDTRDNKKHVIKWKDDIGRIKELERINKLIEEYNLEADKNLEEHFRSSANKEGLTVEPMDDEKPTKQEKLIPLWAFYCKPAGQSLADSNCMLVNDEDLYRMFYFEIKDNNTFVERFNKMIFDHICEMLHEAVELGQYNEKSIWFDPSIGFLNWFQAKGIDHKSIQPLIKGKGQNKIGRPKGLTKRTIDRYIKVFHQFEILKKKFPSMKRSELYDLTATQTYDGRRFAPDTIRHIIEDKKYNLNPSR